MSTHQCGAQCQHHLPDDHGQAATASIQGDQGPSVRTITPGLQRLLDGSWKAGLPDGRSREITHYYVPANVGTVQWGFFSQRVPPILKVQSGDIATIETLTHHANDDAERMVRGDGGAESVFRWDRHGKAIERRGAGALDAVNGAGGGLGVHICTGPIHVEGAEPGDVLEVRILDVHPRASANPAYAGKTFGSNVAANWGLQYGDLLEEPRQREVVTIYELEAAGGDWARAVYSYRWTPQTDPSGIVHPTIDYPGVPVDRATIDPKFGILSGVRIPVRMHFGTIGVAPREADYVSTIPPSYSGGNIDNWRLGRGAVLYLPVAVAGALFSVGDPHASQGDAELCGTAIECSLTGTFQFVLHKKASVAGTPLDELSYPLLETADEWLVHGFSYPNYLAALGPNAQVDIATRGSLDLAMKDAYRKLRGFLMSSQKLSEDEAISLMSVAADFGITQVVDGNWGVHAVIRKCLFSDRS